MSESRIKRPKQVFFGPNGQVLDLKTVNKFYRDTLVYHHGQINTTIDVTIKSGKVKSQEVLATTFDPRSPLGDFLFVPGDTSPVCQKCGLNQCGAKRPFFKYSGPTNPIITIVYESVSPREDESGTLASEGPASFLRKIILDLEPETGVSINDIRWVPITRCSARTGGLPNFKTKGNWCRHYLIQELKAHPPRLIMPIGSTVLGLLNHKSNVQDWGGRTLTWRGWPDDWLTDPNFALPRQDYEDENAHITGHPLFGPPPTEVDRLPIIPVQSPRVIYATQNAKLIARWKAQISDALKAAKAGIQPLNYLRQWYRITTDPSEVKREMQWLIEHPNTVVAYDTETTGLRPWAPGAKIVFMMFRWRDENGPRSIGFPWEYDSEYGRSPLLDHISELSPIVLDALYASRLVGHNLTFDALFTYANVQGANLDRLANQCIYDTWHMAYVCRQQKGSLGLEAITYTYVPSLAGYEEDMTLLIELMSERLHPDNGGHYANCPLDKWDTHLKPYVMGDVESAYGCWNGLTQKLKDCNVYRMPMAHPTERGRFRLYQPISRYDVYHHTVSPAARVLIKFMGRGMHVDVEELARQEDLFPKQIREVRKKLREVDPVVENWCVQEKNLDPAWDLDLENKTHLRTVLFTLLNMPVKALTDGGRKKFGDDPSILTTLPKDQLMQYAAIDKFTLNSLAAEHEKIRPLLEYRKTFKQWSAYIRPMRNAFAEGIDKKKRDKDPHLARDGRVHGRFIIPGTRSGRLSSAEPNLQQLSSKGLVKRIYTSRFGSRGCIYQGDLSQIELRLIAAACGDEAMVNAYRNNIDLHALTHSKIFNRNYEECLKEYVLAMQEKGQHDLAKKLEMERKLAKCVDPETLTVFNGQITRVGDIHPGRDEDRFYPVQGTICGPTGSVPLKHFYSNGIRKRLLVCSKRGMIACSEEHPLLMADGTLKKAKDIRKKDVLAEPVSMMGANEDSAIPFNPVCFTGPTGLFKVHVDNDLAYLLGMFYGDGECSTHIGICFGGKPEFFDWQDVVVESIKKCGFETILERTEWDSDVDGAKILKSGPCKGQELRGSSGHVTFGSTRVQDIFIQLGAIVLTDDTDLGRKRSLRIPTWLFNAKDELKISFLAGWFDTDGTIRQGSLCGCTKSWVLAQDVCVLLSSLSAQFSCSPGLNKTYNKFYYRITVSLGDTWELFEGILRHPVKKLGLRCPLSGRIAKQNLCMEVIELPPGHVVDVEVDTPEHLFVANNLIQRNTTNFLTGYGGGANGLQATLANDGIYYTVEECESFLEKFFDGYPSLRQYLAYYKRFIADHGVAVSIFGRVRAFEEVFSDDKGSFNKALRAGCNHLIQATASDMMLIALCVIESLMRDYNLESVMVSTVHDSLLIDGVREEMPQVHELVSYVFNNMPTVLDAWFENVSGYDPSFLIVPIGGDCEVGPNMLDLNKIGVPDKVDWDHVWDRIDNGTEKEKQVVVEKPTTAFEEVLGSNT